MIDGVSHLCALTCNLHAGARVCLLKTSERQNEADHRPEKEVDSFDKIKIRGFHAISAELRVNTALNQRSLMTITALIG